MKKILTLTASMVAMFAAQAAHAQIVNFEVNVNGQYSGPGVLGTGNEYWNLVSAGPGITSSTESDGSTPSTDGLSFADTNIYTAGGANTSSILLLNEYAYNQSSGADSITFNGLTNGLYNLVLFGINGAYANTYPTSNNETTFALSNTLLDPSDPTQPSSQTTTEISSSAFSDPANYVEFTDVLVTNGKIAATYGSGNSNGEGDFNGAQLQYVGPALTPEPSSVALMAISIGGLAFLARRRLKA